MKISDFPPNTNIVLVTSEKFHPTAVTRDVAGVRFLYLYGTLKEPYQKETPTVFIHDADFNLLRCVFPYAPYQTLPDDCWQPYDPLTGSQLLLFIPVTN